MDKLIKSFKVLKGGLLEKMASTFKDLPDRRNIKLFSSGEYISVCNSKCMKLMIRPHHKSDYISVMNEHRGLSYPVFT